MITAFKLKLKMLPNLRLHKSSAPLIYMHTKNILVKDITLSLTISTFSVNVLGSRLLYVIKLSLQIFLQRIVNIMQFVCIQKQFVAKLLYNYSYFRLLMFEHSRTTRQLYQLCHF